MAVTISRAQAMRLFCLARQAERSIDFALSSERQWDLLRQYCDGGRLGMLVSASEGISLVISASAVHASRDQVFRFSVLWLLTYPARVILNRYRGSWHFREVELHFILQTFQAAIHTFKQAQKPEAGRLVQLRMDLHACEGIINRRLVGLPDIRDAERMEHFCQAPHVNPFKLEEIADSAKPSRLSA